MVAKLAVLFLVFLLLASVQSQEISVQTVREALRRDLDYVRSLLSDDGKLSSGFDPSGSLRGQVLVGSMVAGIHAGLGDPESLALLNKIAEKVNKRVESEDGLDLGFDSEKMQELENFITHVLTADFLAMHYGFTKSLRSKENMLRVADSLEQRLGWTPAWSKAAYLVRSTRVAFISGSQPTAADIENALNEFSTHMMDIVSFSTKSFEGLTGSLSQLSLLLDAVERAGLTAPTELTALWAVHVNYVIDGSKSISVSPENYPALLAAMTSLTYAAENRRFQNSTLAAEQAVKLAEAVAAMWRSGGRILLLPVNVLDVYPLDPLVSAESMMDEIRSGRRPVMADLRFPTLLLTLERSSGLTPELKAVVSLAVGKVAVVDGFFPVLERGVIKSEEFVNRWWRVYLLSTYLAYQREPAARQRNTAAEIFFNIHPSFLAFLSVLLATALLHRAGLLRW
ncbi:MAG: hypothetical protein QXU87_08890 [Candidatus Caldarchaeum sp.]|uniref:Uncharacterized protein n=1 Tax=Caldiarchaeum subterraneum TaxID=311458 RepID=A0A7C5L6R4_CALS0